MPSCQKLNKTPALLLALFCALQQNKSCFYCFMDLRLAHPMTQNLLDASAECRKTHIQRVGIWKITKIRIITYSSFARKYRIFLIKRMAMNEIFQITLGKYLTLSIPDQKTDATSHLH